MIEKARKMENGHEQRWLHYRLSWEKIKNFASFLHASPPFFVCFFYPARRAVGKNSFVFCCFYETSMEL